jgi:DNA-binding NarL/FixJ family response regulator
MLPKTCVIADDHPAVTHMIGRLLEERGYSIVATVPDGDRALLAIEEHRPDVAILDLAMPGLNGLDVTRAIARTSPTTAPLLFTGHSREALVVEALAAGVRGLVLKQAPIAEILRAVDLVASGDIYVDPTLAAPLITARRRRTKAELSHRESEVLRLISEGMTNDQIGADLFISPQTVRTYVRKAMAKLGAANRTQAVATALRRSLIA